MLDKLLPPDMYKSLIKEFQEKDICEIRIRTGLPLKVNINGKYIKVKNYINGDSYVCTSCDVDYVLGRATKHSIYTANETILDGFIPYFGGIRIGVAGEGVIECGKLLTVKNISYLTIRIPKQIKTSADKLQYDYNLPCSFLIVSPPGAGKTTLIREMIRRISVSGENCLVIDERNEIAGSNVGERFFDLGENTDVVTSVPKSMAMEGIIRAMRPDMIFTDEIYGEKEVELISETLRAGIKVGATVHSGSRFDLIKDKVFKNLLRDIPYVIQLSDKPSVGSVVFEGLVNVDGIGG